jgi:hypothetical protein
LVPVMNVTYLNLDEIKIEGRGLQKFVVGELNFFKLSAVRSSNIGIVFSNLHATTVSISDLSKGGVEVCYRVCDDIPDVAISVLVSSAFHSEHLSLRSLTAADLIDKLATLDINHVSMFQPDYEENPGVVLAELQALTRVFDGGGPIVSLARIVLGAAYRHHLQNEGVQFAGLQTMYLILKYKEYLQKDVRTVSEHICAAMSAHPDSRRIQIEGCWAIYYMAEAHTNSRPILRACNAIDICQRARAFSIHGAAEALRLLV